MPYQTINPYNGELLRTFEDHTDEQMEAFLTKADDTFRNTWSKFVATRALSDSWQGCKADV